MSDQTNTIELDDFLKVDIRAGQITAAERLPKSKKLLKLQVSFGDMGARQVLAGIGESFEPADVIGRTVAFVVNLKPRKMMGEESNGMILAASVSTGFNGSGVEGKALSLLDAPTLPGTRIG